MNQHYLHLLSNHAPIIGVMLATVFLAAGLILKNKTVKISSLFLFLFTAVCAIVANATGEGAEEAVEEMAGVSHRVIHRHEEVGERFLMTCMALGLFSVLTLIFEWKKKGFVRYFYFLMLLVSLLSCFFAYRTGKTGGKIRRPEYIMPQDTVRMKRPS